MFILYFSNSLENNIWMPLPIIKTEVNDFVGVSVKLEPLDTYEDNSMNEASTYSMFAENPYNNVNCELCPAVYNNLEDLDMHKKQSHGMNYMSYICRFCGVRFVHEAHFSDHMITHSLEFQSLNNSSTLSTENQSSSRSYLSMNLRNKEDCKSPLSSTQNSCYASPENNSQRKRLPKNASSKSKPVNQKKTKERKPFTCQNCVYATISKNEYLSHKKNCNMTDSSEQYASTSGVNNRTPYCCTLCSRSFVSQCSLNGHMNYHKIRGELTNKKTHTLKKIKVEFSNNKDDILKSQKGIFRYQCNDCHRSYISRNKLNNHRLQHQKQMICNVCKKQFFFAKNYEKHMLSHESYYSNNNVKSEYNTSLNNNDETLKKIDLKFVKKNIKSEFKDSKRKVQKRPKKIKPYSCYYCKTYYSSVTTLKQHYKIYHVDKNTKFLVPCSWCNIVVTKNNLLRHIRKLHPDVKPIKCSFCQFKFKYHKSLKLHIFKYHKQ